MFDLVTEERKSSIDNDKLILTDYEYKKLKTAYDKTMSEHSSNRKQEGCTTNA